MNPRHDIMCLGICLTALSLMISGCAKKTAKFEIPPRPVKTAVASQKDVPFYVESFGNLTSSNTVDLKAQITGIIKSVHYREGDRVTHGALLVTLDPVYYQAEFDKAQASLEMHTVDLKLKRDTFERNKKLFEKNLISQQDFEKYQTDFAAAEAQVKIDKAAVDLARINLGYCFIRSPVDGLTGKRLVDPGNIVMANSGSALVNIRVTDPLYADFTLPERYLADVRKAMAEAQLKVELRYDLTGGSQGPYPGELIFINNTVDNTTGTISMRAIVPNKEGALWVGQFVQVRLFLGVRKNAVIVPYEAVQIGKQGSYVFAVTPSNTADLKLVTPGNQVDDYIVVEKGVTEGEKVVTVGQLGLSPGAPVVDIALFQAEKKRAEAQAENQPSRKK